MQFSNTAVIHYTDSGRRLAQLGQTSTTLYLKITLCNIGHTSYLFNCHVTNGTLSVRDFAVEVRDRSRCRRSTLDDSLAVEILRTAEIHSHSEKSLLATRCLL